MENHKKKLYERYVSSEQGIIGASAAENLFEKCDLLRMKDVALRFLPKDKNISIADLGCGHGKLIGILKQLGYENITGVEVSDEQIELAKKFGINSIEKGDLKDYLKSSGNKFDAIFLMNILEHFDKTEAFEILEMIFNALKDNGTIIIRVPNAEGIFGNRAFFGDYTHETFFTALSLKQVFKTIGFDDVRFLGEPPVIHGLKSGFRFILWKLFESFMKLALYAETGPANYILTQNLICAAKKN